MNLEVLSKLAQNAARTAGKSLKKSVLKETFSEEGRDIKAAADKKAEKIILEILEQSKIPVLSEESGFINSDNFSVPINKESSFIDFPSIFWIIDPLDGTFNYLRGLPLCCVSIALWRGSEPVIGVIYNFQLGDLYLGIEGHIATKNGEPISISDTKTFEKASLASGFPSKRNFGREALDSTLSDIQKYKKIRMLGSAAMSLAFVAEGVIDAYKEEDIWIWDVAAGMVIVKAAGGTNITTRIKKSFQLNIFSSNKFIIEQMKDI